jgi:exodeoxyribonuclease V gamma subunit
MSFYLHRGSRLEDLAEGFAKISTIPLSSPLAPEIVLVQSNGMARWLSLRLADHHRICSNVRFPFPAAYSWELFRLLQPELPERSSFNPAVLTWRIFALLPQLLSDPVYQELAAYLQNGDALTRFELARRLADVFDQYLVYRPEWILEWEAGEGEHWQAALWRRLVDAGTGHRAELLLRAIRGLEKAPPAGVLPERLSLFGIASLPQSQLALFQTLARHIDVHVFLLDPSEAYWGEIRSQKEIARRAGEQDSQALYLETGNKLLASLGRQGRDFMDLLLECDPRQYEYFGDAEPGCLLEALQADIRRLENPDPAARRPLAADDCSLQIHSCHSRMREVEVLHDQLLGLLEEHPALGPADIVVMAPDIEAYAPFIEAVFANAPRIPFAIADLSLRREQPVVRCLLALLGLRDARFEADAVAALLEVPALQAKFGFTEAQLPRLLEWIRQTGIRWGIDAEHRAGLGLPAVADHSWRLGLERMLLGYAMPAREQRLFAGILPFDEVEGSGAELAGRLLMFTDALFELPALLAEARTPAQWRQRLNALIESFFAPTDDGEEAALGRVRQLLDELAAAAEAAGITEPLPLEVIAAQLRRCLEAGEGAGGFLSGGVTFCAMVPMRSIPFQVVCLLGMNDGEFPRQQRPLGFDLMARQPRRGDRSRRFEDRYLFLEALLSARRCFYLSYVGQDMRDNAQLPPSVVVDELLDCIDAGWQATAAADVRKQLITRHRLQPFSPSYFASGAPTGDHALRLFSYAAHLCEAGALAGRGRRQPASIFAGALPEPEPQWREIELSRLIEFWSCPAEFLLRQRLGLNLGEGEGPLEGCEPFALDGLQQWQLNQDLLALGLSDAPTDPEALARAAGRLPHGVVGQQVLAGRWAEAQAFATELQTQLPDVPLEPQPFTLQLESFRLVGVLGQLDERGRYDYRFGSDRSKDLLRVWINHLVLNLVAPAGVPVHSRWISKKSRLGLGPVAEAERHLQTLLEYYWLGLRQPLPFFPRASLDCAAALAKGKDGPAAARRGWEGNGFETGECEQVYLKLAFEGGDPLAEPLFLELVQAVWVPLLAALEEMP